jgi:predicted PurR-regulated permease PerM
VRVPPIVTLFTIVLWGEIFGIGGLLLALPINLVLWTMAEHFIGAKSEVLLNEHGEAIAPHVEIKR